MKYNILRLNQDTGEYNHTKMFIDSPTKWQAMRVGGKALETKLIDIVVDHSSSNEKYQVAEVQCHPYDIKIKGFIEKRHRLIFILVDSLMCPDYHEGHCVFGWTCNKCGWDELENGNYDIPINHII